VKNVEILLRDLCAVSKLSKMFRKSETPNFVTFVLNFESLQKNELIQDLLKNLYKKAASNFAKNFGSDATFGEVLYVPALENIEKE